MVMRHRYSTRGEIALTFTVASLFLMVVGSIFGLGVNKTQDVRTNAAGALCGKTCTGNGDCGTDTTTGTQTTCDRAIGKCTAVRDPKNPPCNATGPNSLGQCNEFCKSNEQCNSIDKATGITLACDLSSGSCQQKYVNDTRQCPGYVRPTPRTGSTGTGGAEGVFKSSQYACGVGFRVVVDPLISKITLSGTGGTYDIGIADVVDPASSGFTGPTTPQEYRMWKPATSDPADNLLIEWNPATTYGISGVPKGALHVKVRSGNPSNPNSKVNPQVDFYYFRNVPSWLKDGSPVRVSFSYYTLSGAQSRPVRTDSTIGASSLACPGVLTTPEPTIPLDPTIARIVTPRNTVAPTAVLTRVPSIPPTRAPSVPPTRAPTTPPTRVPSRTQTPTPPSCSTDITFMIDASESTQAILNQYQTAITDAVHIYGRANPQDNIDFYTNFFARDVQAKKGPFTAADFQFPIVRNLHWTNIKEALESTSGKTIFISDGTPSVVRYAGANNNGFCVYPDGPNMLNKADEKAAGCAPRQNEKDGYTRLNTNACASVCSENTYANANADSRVAKNKNNTYGVFVKTGLFSDVEFMESVSTDVIDISEVSATIGEIFDRACGRGGTGTLGSGNRSRGSSGSRGGRRPASTGPLSLTSTFVITNQSTEKTVESVSVKACDVNGDNCQTYDNPLRIEPGATGRFSQTIPSEVPAQNRAMVTCDINNDDGTSLSCPQKATNDDGIRFDLSVVDEEVLGDSKSFEKAADINKDGQIRANDYALCLVGNKLCDIIADEDNEVNALDRSVVYERLTNTTQ